MRATRLFPSDDYDWELWGKIRPRARELGNEIGGMDVETFIREIGIKWVQYPDWQGIWAFLDDDGRVVGHAICTVELMYGDPVLYCHQLSIDNPTTRTFRNFCFNEIWSWIEKLNQTYEANRSPLRLQKTIRFFTMRPKGIMELLKAFKPEHVFSVVDIKLEDQLAKALLYPSNGMNNNGR